VKYIVFILSPEKTCVYGHLSGRGGGCLNYALRVYRELKALVYITEMASP